MTDAANEPVVAEASPAARVALRRLRHRRSKLIKSLLMITVVSALMVVISVNERDRQQGKRCRRSLARYAQMIQQSLPGPIPAELLWY